MVDWAMVGDAAFVVVGLLTLGYGGYVWVGFAARRFFQERERHVKRVIDMTEKEES